jgi:hypothetical protein
MSIQGPREGRGARPQAGGNQLQGFRGAGARIDIASAAEKSDLRNLEERKRPRRDSNPCCCLERAVSWASRRQGRKNVSRAGLEPATPGLKGRCSPSELTARKKPSYYSGRAERVNPGPLLGAAASQGRGSKLMMTQRLGRRRPLGSLSAYCRMSSL